MAFLFKYYVALGMLASFILQKRVTRHSFSSTVCIQKRVTACVLGSRRSVFKLWYTEQLHSILGFESIIIPYVFFHYYFPPKRERCSAKEQEMVLLIIVHPWSEGVPDALGPGEAPDSPKMILQISFIPTP